MVEARSGGRSLAVTARDSVLLFAKRSIWSATRRIGLDVRRWPSEGTIERDLQRLIAFHDIETVVDIGANEGQYGTMLRMLGFAGRLISVEPNPSSYRRLAAIADRDPRWIAIECAAGADGGTAQLSVFDNDQLSSLHRTTAWARDVWDFGESQQLEVLVRSLDDLAESYGVNPESSLLKLDTQGHDMSIVRASHFATRAAGLQIEMPVLNLYEDVPRFASITSEIDGLGFRPIGFYPVQRERTNGLLPIEFDGLFVRT